MASVKAGEILPEGGEKPEIVQCVLLDGDGNPVSECMELGTLPKYFPFREPKIRMIRSGRQVTLQADTFCTGVELQAGEARFSDNWLTLYPGEARTVTADRDFREDELRVLWLE